MQSKNHTFSFPLGIFFSLSRLSLSSLLSYREFEEREKEREREKCYRTSLPIFSLLFVFLFLPFIISLFIFSFLREKTKKKLWRNFLIFSLIYFFTVFIHIIANFLFHIFSCSSSHFSPLSCFLLKNDKWNRSKLYEVHSGKSEEIN